jgi:hypothetical protein
LDGKFAGCEHGLENRWSLQYGLGVGTSAILYSSKVRNFMEPLKIGDIVTSYYSGYWKIIGFFDYDGDNGRKVPQVSLEKICDDTGRKRKVKKSCALTYCTKVDREYILTEWRKDTQKWVAIADALEIDTKRPIGLNTKQEIYHSEIEMYWNPVLVDLDTLPQEDRPGTGNACCQIKYGMGAGLTYQNRKNSEEGFQEFDSFNMDLQLAKHLYEQLGKWIKKYDR